MEIADKNQQLILCCGFKLQDDVYVSAPPFKIRFEPIGSLCLGLWCQCWSERFKVQRGEKELSLERLRKWVEQRGGEGWGKKKKKERLGAKGEHY